MAAKKISKVKFFIFLFSLAFVALLIELAAYIQCYSFVQKVPEDDGQILRIIFFGSSENPEGETVSAKIYVLDRNGFEIAEIERSWPKPYLSVDFRSATFLKKTYFFPEKIYGTSTVSSESKNIWKSFERSSSSYLERYYIKKRRCLLGTDEIQQKCLYRFFKFALNKNTVNLSECETGKTYGVFAKNGNLTVQVE